ncbi:cyclic nucleotide-binding domain-containing protein [Terasakiella sp.]|uniref:cyclic nucleotide-binding domain-containing protein n=1 Tax=Terasakiella sp. TaxID=2034861 RepID=UPI003AA864BB
MRKVLFILGQLSDNDTEWMARAGTKKSISDGDVIIQEGVGNPDLFILLQGILRIEDAKIGPIAELGTGEIVGEMSFVDNAPPSASVIAKGDCMVLQLSHDLLESRIEADPFFGMRLYKALSFFLADRLRGTVRRFGYGEANTNLDSDEILADELDENLLDTVSIAGDRFDRMLKQLASAKTA